jgi:hypothetical protein
MKGMSVEECVEKAEKLISKHGICLLLFDVKNSRGFADREKLRINLLNMMKDLNEKFRDYFPENNLTSPTKRKGFEDLLGDGSWAGIDFPYAIEEIINYQKEAYPKIELYWGIAKDGFDEEGIKIVK